MNGHLSHFVRIFGKTDDGTHSRALPRRANPRYSSRQSRVERLEDRLLLSLNPTPMEQEMLEHINRIRMYPEAELNVLFDYDDPSVSPHIAEYESLRSDLEAEWESLTWVQPLAWHESLNDAAVSHNEQMIDNKMESYAFEGEGLPIDRAIDAGYPNPIFVYANNTAHAKSVFHAYADFAVNWDDETRADRKRLMGLGYHEIGIDIAENDPAENGLGSRVVTATYGTRFGIGSLYLLGVVYTDTNENGRYDAGEGREGVNIHVTGDNGFFHATTMDAGGYQVKVPPGYYTLTASGGGLSEPIEYGEFQMGSRNLKIDFVADITTPTMPDAFPDAYSVIRNKSLTVAAPGILKNDIANDQSLTPELVHGPSHGSLTFGTDGSFQYTPTADFTGTDAFYYRAGNSNTTSVSIEVKLPDGLPVAVNDCYLADGTSTLVVAAPGILSNDTSPNGSPLTAIRGAAPAHGTLLAFPGDGSFAYNPTAGYHGTDTFSYTVSDGESESENAAIVQIHVAMPIDASFFHDETPLSGDLWYRGTATRSGTLSLEATFGGGDGVLELYADLCTSIVTSTLQEDRHRIDREVTAGETFFVRLFGNNVDADLTVTNLLQTNADGTEVLVHGTDAGDTAGLAIGDSLTITINGISYHLDNAQSVTFYGQGGDDHAAITTSSGDFTATPGFATLLDEGVYTFDGFETIVAETTATTGEARLQDSLGDDLFVAGPNYGILSGDGFSLRAIGFRKILATADSGGYDLAQLYDSSVDDLLHATPTEAAMYPAVGESFENHARYFDETHAFSPGGGYDSAILFDSQADDMFIADPDEATMLGNAGGGVSGQAAYLNRAKGFEEVLANATDGGIDHATLSGGPNDDTFYGSPVESTLTGPGYAIHARYFEQVHATAGRPGEDRAVLSGSDEADLLVAADDRVTLSNPTLPFLIEAIAFGQVEAIATGDGDTKDTTEPIDFLLTFQGLWFDL